MRSYSNKYSGDIKMNFDWLFLCITDGIENTLEKYSSDDWQACSWTK